MTMKTLAILIRATPRGMLAPMTDGAERPRIERLLEIEFENLQRINDKYDGSRFLMKGWSVTAGGAALAVSVAARQPALALIGCGVVLVFLYLETLYMVIQNHVIARCNHVESLIADMAAGGAPADERGYRFGVSHAFEGRFTVKGFFRALHGRPHIYVPYLGLVATLAADAVALAVL